MKFNEFVKNELFRQSGQLGESFEKIVEAVLTDGCESGIITSLIYNVAAELLEEQYD